MVNKKIIPRLIKTKYGFYQYRPLPSEDELEKYYAQKYYQQGLGSYEVSYTDEEIKYFKLKAKLIYLKSSHIINLKKPKSFIDIGCGEGWALNEFFQNGHNVFGIDFSKYGIAKFHPHLLKFFEQGNIFKKLKQIIQKGGKYNIILLANVIEHVIDPVKLLQNIKQIMFPDSLLIIVAPNDFSPLHRYLIKNRFISKKFWLRYPDHISYFNKKSMEKLLHSFGFRVEAVVADNPVDLNLLNDNSNYIKDPSKGKKTHLFRVRVDNFLASLNLTKLLQIYEILGSMGIGRDLNYYCSLAKDE